jgi:preprotein translocase subunit SecF
MDFNIPFMKYRKIAAYASLALFVISIVSLSFRGLSLGLDFSGGTLVEVTYEDSVNLEEVRGMLRYVSGFGNDPALRCLPFPI